MKTILVLAYQLSASKGSEFSVAWNYISNMSRSNKLTVLFGVTGEHLGDIDDAEIQSWQKILPNVEFIPVRPSRRVNLLNSLNRRGVLVYTFYLAYKAWHKQVYRMARSLAADRHFDLVHYLNPIGYREPGYLWKLDLPYMWGPICGMDNYPSAMFDLLSPSFRLKYVFRNVANNLQLRFSSRIRKAMRRADKLLVATTSNAYLARHFFGVNPGYLPENAMAGPAVLNESKFSNSEGTIRIVFVGTLDGRKNVMTILKALEKAGRRDRFHLDVLGDGPLKESLVQYAEEHSIAGLVDFRGKVSRDEVFSFFDNAHLHVIASIGEGNPTTIWEAMAHGVPTLTVDHCGMHDTVSDESGYKVPVASCEQISSDMAAVLDGIAANPEELKTRALAVARQSKKYLWPRRIDFFERCYDECIEHYNKSKEK